MAELIFEVPKLRTVFLWESSDFVQWYVKLV